MSEPSGYIRFVGGPLHNQHRCVRWHSYLSVPAIQPVPVAYVHPETEISKKSFGCIDYILTHMATDKGGFYYEYHAGREHEHSGDDFFCDLGDRMFERFCFALFFLARRPGWKFRGLMGEAINPILAKPGIDEFLNPDLGQPY